LSDSQLEYQFGGRHFSFIGWIHNTDVDQKQAIEALNAMSKRIANHNCDGINAIYDDYVLASQKRFNESQRVYNLLETVRLRNHFTALGTEYTDAELLIYKRDIDQIDTADTVLTVISKVCPGFDGRKLHMVYPGPEFEFTKRHSSSVTLIPLEDQKIKDKWLSQIPQEDFDFDPSTSGFSEQTLAAIDHLDAVANEAEKQKLMAMETAPELKAKIARLYEARKIAVNSDVERNQAIVDHMLAMKDNFAVVIGKSHIRYFLDQLDKACRDRRDAPAKTEYGSPSAATTTR
jgi:hypothetical protein